MRTTSKCFVLLLLIGLCFSTLASAELIAKKPDFDDLPYDVKTLIEKLYSTDRIERRNATLELWDMGPSASYAVPHLIMMLQDDDWNVRKDAIFALSIICDKRSVEHLKRIMKEDPVPALRKAAELALKNMFKTQKGACDR